MAEQIVDTETFTVSVSNPELSVQFFNTPNQACAGTDVRMSIDVENSGGCDGTARAIVTNNIDDSTIESSPTTVRGDSTRSLRLQDTIPSAASEEGSITYTATIVDAEGDQITQETSTINIGSVNISLQNLEFPSTVCAGQSADGEVEVTNNGDCPSSVTISLSQESTESTDIIETIEVREDSSDTVRFTYNIPLESRQVEEDVFTVTSQVPGADENIVTDRQEARATIETTDIQLVSISSPDSACVGDPVSNVFNISNNSPCGGEVRILVTDSVSGSQEVAGRREVSSQIRDTISFDDVIPAEALEEESINYSYEVQNLISGTFQTIESGSFSIDVNISNLSINEVDVPNSYCIGRSLPFSISIANSGQCKSEYRLIAEDITRGETYSINTSTLTNGSSITEQFEDELGKNLSTESEVRYRIILEKRFNEEYEWNSVDQTEVSVNIQKPDVSISSTNYPDFTIPGEKQYEIELTNDSQCATNVEVNISGSTREIDIGSETSMTITDDFIVTADPNTREITVVDNRLSETVDSSEVTIEPHKFINVNQSEGVLEIKGGFGSEIVYSGTLVATGVGDGSDLEDRDTIVGIGGVYSIQGTSSTDSTDIDSFSFGTLKGVNIQLSESASVVVDGEVKGQSRSYRHSTITSSVLQIDDDNSPRIQTASGPLSNVGALRRRLDIDANVLSGPLFTVDR